MSTRKNGGKMDTAAEPLSDEEIAAFELDMSRPDDAIHGRSAAYLRRLLATIRVHAAMNTSTSSLAYVSAEAILAAWLAHGGIEYATQKLSVLRDLVRERVAAERKKVEEVRAEIAARYEAMEKHFSALGFPGGPPIDEAEAARAKDSGVRRLKPTPPADDVTLRAALVQRILVLRRDRPKDPPTTRGLAKWSGATGQRVELVLKDAPEVALNDKRWLPREA